MNAYSFGVESSSVSDTVSEHSKKNHVLQQVMPNDPSVLIDVIDSM